MDLTLRNKAQLYLDLDTSLVSTGLEQRLFTKFRPDENVDTMISRGEVIACI